MAKKATRSKAELVKETKEAMSKAVKQSNGAIKKGTSGKEYVRVSAGIEWWSPKKKGDIIEGKFVEYLKFKNKFGTPDDEGKPPMIDRAILKKDDGSQFGLPSHASLMNQLKGNEKRDVLIEYLGERLKKGMTKNQKNSTYHDYAVYLAD